MTEPLAVRTAPENRRQESLQRLPVVIALLISILMASGGVIALLRPGMLVSPGSEITSAVHVYAEYFVSRNLAVSAFLVIALLLRASRALANFMFLAAVIQLFDAILDAVEGRWSLVPGILVIGIALVAGAVRLSGNAFWKRSFWCD